MAFPVVAGTATTNGITGTSTPIVDLPASIVAGDLLLVLIRHGNAPDGLTWPTGWTERFDSAIDASNDSLSLGRRKADGTEGATITITVVGTSGKFAALAWRITGAADPTSQEPEFAAITFGDSTLPDPGSITPTGGAKDYLFLWMGGWQGEQTSPPASNPTGYTSNILGADSGVAGTLATNVRVASATRNLNAASEDPGSWTISAADPWMATVVAVHPAPAGQQFTITLDEAVGAADAEPRQTGKALPDTAALADALSRLTGRSLAEAIALADAITKAPGRVLVDDVAMADTVEAERIIVKELLEALALADVLTRAASRTVVEGVTLADLVERLTARQLTDSAAVADVLSRLTGRPLSETASLADTLTATLIVEHTVLEAVATVDDVAVSVGRVLVDTATVVDVLSRVTGRALVEAVALADAATKAVSRGLLDQVAVADTLTVLRISLMVLSESAALADTFDSNLTPYSGPTLPAVIGGTRAAIRSGHTMTDRGSSSYTARRA